MFKRKRIYFKSRWLFLYKKEIFKIQLKYKIKIGLNTYLTFPKKISIQTIKTFIYLYEKEKKEKRKKQKIFVKLLALRN